MSAAMRGNKRGKSCAARARQKICRTQVIDFAHFHAWQCGTPFAALKPLIPNDFLVWQTLPPKGGARCLPRILLRLGRARAPATSTDHRPDRK